MGGQDFWGKLKWFDTLVISLIALGVVILGAGVWRQARGGEEQVRYISGGEVAGESVNKIFVDVGGAVEKPGVYELEQGARLKDALVAAGGLSENADREWVERTLNMAKEVKDGEKIYVSEITNSKLQMLNEDQNQNSQNSKSSLIDINTASQSELDSLWGVGEARARAIIEGRPYGSIEELLEKKILPKNVFEANKDKMSVY